MSMKRQPKRDPLYTTATISVPREMLEWIDEYCTANDVDRSKFVRSLVKEKRAKYAQKGTQPAAGGPAAL